MSPSLHLWLIPLLPFAGFLLNGLLGRRLPKAAITAIALLTTGAAFADVLTLALHFGSLTLPHVEKLANPWITVSGFQVNFSFYLDQLTLVMLLVVTGVGFLIHLYSCGYMAEEEGYWRFFAYLNLFMFFMLTLVLAENFLLMFVGWEGVGLASYLLIGFYFNKKSAADAGKKAFLVNRVGDFGFLLAMFLMIAHFQTLSFTEIFARIAAEPGMEGGFLTAIALLMVVGATGKSAQIPLYVWLPDAMEGPTPVSALIHAATMVTAGIYMVARSHSIFDRSPLALSVVAIIGALTAFFAATVGIVQTDIKRVLAYSTISQLGYMFLACGVAAYSAAVFHLVTHAFFKALLFLAAGSVIHALGGEQDMLKMGGLRTKIPVTFWTMTAGVFAIAGFFPFAGFFSKDEILYQVFFHGNKVLWFLGILTAFITSFYMFRLWYLTFFGASRAEAQADAHIGHGHGHSAHGSHEPHESPWIMLLPLVLLAILAVAGGWMGWPEFLYGHNSFAHFLDPVFHTQGLSFEQKSIALAVGAPGTTDAAGNVHDSFGQELILAGISLLMAALGWFLADTFYRRRPDLPEKWAGSFSGIYKVLVAKYGIDELYSLLIVTPLVALSRIVLWRGVDGGLIDGSGTAVSAGTNGLGAIIRRVQSGNIRSYAGWLAFGAAAVLIVIVYLIRV